MDNAYTHIYNISGPVAEAYFNPAVREKVLDLYQFGDDRNGQRQRRMMARILQGLSVLIRVSGSRNLIKTQEFHEYNYETYLVILELFPWLGVNNTLHFFLAHVAQVIWLNGSRGLAQLGEGIIFYQQFSSI